MVFYVPNTRHYTEWSLIGRRDSISLMHIDAKRFGTVIIMLEERKYWIVVTLDGRMMKMFPPSTL